MKHSQIVIIQIFFILLILPGMNQESYGWSLTDILQGTPVPDNFDPERDILFIPPLGDKDLFESIDDLSITRDAEVRKFIILYLTTGKDYLTTAIIRSHRYINIIQDIFSRNKDIPAQLALLPLLESAYNPYAVSRSKAVGLWQFLKGTGRSLGLKTNTWVDERRDIEKSTEAAIKHLRNLHGIFKSWDLALASYNGGAGHVKRAMKKSGSKNIEQLIQSSKLKKETREYVARFAALSVIYKNQQLFDIKDDAANLQCQETDTVIIEFPVSITHISTIAEVSTETIRICNPELKKNFIPPYERKYSLRVPVDAKEKIEKNSDKLYSFSYKKVRTHIVREGECISKIAARYGASMQKILTLNKIQNPRQIRPGLELYIPI